MEKKMTNRPHVPSQVPPPIITPEADNLKEPEQDVKQIVDSPARNGNSGTRRPSRGSIGSGRGSVSPRGKSRLGVASQGDEYDEGYSTVPPPFGEWEDKNNTSAVQGYTKVFNRVSKERHGGGGGYVHSPNYRGAPKQTNESTSCCFSWGRKK